MTLIEAINKVDALKPNVYTQQEKTDWISTLDGMIKRDIVDTHKGFEEVEFHGYDENTPTDQVLIAEAPYDEMYVTWLEAKIDYHNGEYVKYNNSITRFNDTFSQYQSAYNRTHMPLGSKFRYW